MFSSFMDYTVYRALFEHVTLTRTACRKALEVEVDF